MTTDGWDISKRGVRVELVDGTGTYVEFVPCPSFSPNAVEAAASKAVRRFVDRFREDSEDRGEIWDPQI